MTDLLASIRDFYTAPPHLSRERQRFFVLGLITASIAGLYHALLIPLFLWMNLPTLVLYNVFSALTWMVVFWLIRRGHIYVPSSLGFLEVCLYVALCAYHMGRDAGSLYLLFTLAFPINFFPFNRSFKAFWLATTSITFILVYLSVGDVVWMGNPVVLTAFYLHNGVIALGLCFLIGGYQANVVRNAEQAMDEAHALSEALLNNVMPSTIADRLKQGEAVIADSFAETSILFADIVNFTPLSEGMTPAEVVRLLDDLFSRIDALVYEHQLEKIKTVGDAYMVVAGIPVRRNDHAEAMAAFALDLQHTLATYNAETGRDLHFRIGINSGPVVAGVIGKLRFLYDLWGDTVNTASRMESHGLPDEIQVTEETRNLLKDKYVFEERGIIEVKGKGQMRTYFLRGKASWY